MRSILSLTTSAVELAHPILMFVFIANPLDFDWITKSQLWFFRIWIAARGVMGAVVFGFYIKHFGGDGAKWPRVLQLFGIFAFFTDFLYLSSNWKLLTFEVTLDVVLKLIGAVGKAGEKGDDLL